MADNKRSSILGWVAEVNDDEDYSSSGDEAQKYLTPLGDEEADHNSDPDEEPAPVPDFEDFPIGNTPASGEWGLNKKEQRTVDLVHREEQNIIKKQESRKQDTKRKDRGSSARKNNGPFSVPPSTTTIILTAGPTSRTDAFLDSSLRSLDFNITTPSISTGLAGMGLMPATHTRKRNRQQLSGKRKFKSMNEEEPEALGTTKEEEATSRNPALRESRISIKPDPVAVSAHSAYVNSSTGNAAASPAPVAPLYAFTYSIENAPKQSLGSFNTYSSSIPHSNRGKVYVDTAIQTDPPHICIGDCQCPIWVIPKSTTSAPAKLRVRKMPPHVAHTHRMMALKREADARRDPKLMEEGLELPGEDPTDLGKVVFYKEATEYGGYESVKQVWRNGKTIE